MPHQRHLTGEALAMLEDEILRVQEPSALYKSIEAPGISTGRQSRVSILEFRLQAGPEYVVWKRMGVDKGLTQNEANNLHDRLRRYRRSLRQYGWNVPKLFHTHTTQVGDEWQIYSYEEYIPGGDGDYMVRSPDQPNFKKWQLLRAAIETLAEYPASALSDVSIGGKSGLTLLPHGLDLKLANIVSSDSVLYFVDFFGPKELTSDHHWVSYNKS